MKILISNDDGIFAPGIVKLAEAAKNFGDVIVAAPSQQCSGMSQRVTLEQIIKISEYDFPVAGVEAYSIDGTPADCVRAAMGYILPQKPDIVFSGINKGYNLGTDIAYSGTIGAATEALIAGVPTIAFSRKRAGIDGAIDANINKIIEQILQKEQSTKEIWNVNFPGCEAGAVKGILWDRKIAVRRGFCLGPFVKAEGAEGLEIIQPEVFERDLMAAMPEENTDLYAVLHNYISIGKIKVSILANS